MVRLGDLKAWDQNKGGKSRVAPERHGLWAFPWPYFDMFFAYHKHDELLPKHLVEDAIRKISDENEERDPPPRMPMGSGMDYRRFIVSRQYKAYQAEREAWQERNREVLEHIQALYTEREKWIDKHGYKPRTFWWQGDVWSRFTLRGYTEILPKDEEYYGWTLLPFGVYVRELQRLEHNGGGRNDDGFEVFLGRSRGLVVGRNEASLHKGNKVHHTDIEDE